MLPPPSCHPQISREIKKIKPNKVTKTNKQTKKIDKQTNKQKKPSTVVPELVTLGCSLTHVLQVPNTQPYHSRQLIGWGYM